MGENADIELRRLSFEEKKWADELSLRKIELDTKVRESKIVARLFSPVTATVLAGMVTVIGSVTATLLQNRHSILLEKKKWVNSQELEREKQQHELIVKMVSVDDIEQARANVRFLAETQLISDKALAKRLLETKETPLIRPQTQAPQINLAPNVSGSDIRRLVSDEALDMMVTAEGGAPEIYRATPRFLGAFGGVTIGIGYDLGHTTADRFREDWGGYLNQADFGRLLPAIGKTGDDARLLIDQLASIEIRREDAVAVFLASLPRWAMALETHIPNARELPPSCYGALLSLVYNRGTPFKATGDRYTEMRAIAGLMERKNFAAIPEQFRAMKRLWPAIPPLVKRRENEALLFEKGLAQLNTPSQR